MFKGENMKALRCSACGANINKNTNKCEYCGTQYEDQKDNKIIIEAQKKQKTKPKAGRGELLNALKIIDTFAGSKNFDTSFSSFTTRKLIMVLLIFAVLVIALVSGISLFVLIPLLPILFIVITLLFSASHSRRSNTFDKIIGLIENEKDKEAYEYAKQRATNNNMMLATMVLIAFYLRDDMETAKNNINNIKTTTYSTFAKFTKLLDNVAIYFNDIAK